MSSPTTFIFMKEKNMSDIEEKSLRAYCKKHGVGVFFVKDTEHIKAMEFNEPPSGGMAQHVSGFQMYPYPED